MPFAAIHCRRRAAPSCRPAAGCVLRIDREYTGTNLFPRFFRGLTLFDQASVETYGTAGTD